MSDKQELADKLLSNYVVSVNGCWLWTKSTTHLGYGRMWWGNRVYGVHRLSAHLWLGLDLGNKKIFACHKCDSPQCFNPNHLFIGTQKDNMADCLTKGRGFKGAPKREVCKEGHQMDDSKSRVKHGCRVCSNANQRKYRNERKATAGLIIKGVLEK